MAYCLANPIKLIIIVESIECFYMAYSQFDVERRDQAFFPNRILHKRREGKWTDTERVGQLAHWFKMFWFWSRICVALQTENRFSMCIRKFKYIFREPDAVYWIVKSLVYPFNVFCFHQLTVLTLHDIFKYFSFVCIKLWMFVVPMVHTLYTVRRKIYARLCTKPIKLNENQVTLFGFNSAPLFPNYKQK